jgi:hypothetical protein
VIGRLENKVVVTTGAANGIVNHLLHQPSASHFIAPVRRAERAHVNRVGSAMHCIRLAGTNPLRMRAAYALRGLSTADPAPENLCESADSLADDAVTYELLSEI